MAIILVLKAGTPSLRSMHAHGTLAMRSSTEVIEAICSQMAAYAGGRRTLYTAGMKATDTGDVPQLKGHNVFNQFACTTADPDKAAGEGSTMTHCFDRSQLAYPATLHPVRSTGARLLWHLYPHSVTAPVTNVTVQTLRKVIRYDGTADEDELELEREGR